jgi:uncharacterized protein YcbK (DUF882 family)
MPMRRSGTVTLALMLALAARSSPARAHAAEAEDAADEAPAVPDAPVVEAAKRHGGAKKKKNKVVGHVVPEAQLRATPLPTPSGHVELYSLATGEEADLEIFNDDGSYDIDELHAADHILRCKRTDDEKPIDPRLIALLSHVYDHFGKRLEIVSGYRNQRKQTSYHYKGSASDIRIPGVAPKKIAEFAATLDAGGMGIGLYPRSQFVHIDVRPPPSYRWLDNARPNPNSPDKRPPRGWKRKKLQS